MVIVGVVEHGEEDEERDQQVGQVDGEQDQALVLCLRAQVLRLGEVVEQDVCQDGKQGGCHMGGIDNCRSPYPFAATCRGSREEPVMKYLEARRAGWLLKEEDTTHCICRERPQRGYRMGRKPNHL